MECACDESSVPEILPTPIVAPLSRADYQGVLPAPAGRHRSPFSAKTGDCIRYGEFGEKIISHRKDVTMSTPEPMPVDADPPEDPAGAEQVPAQLARPDAADASRTEYPVPESSPSGGSDEASA